MFDEETIVALALLNFITIFYLNVSTLVNNVLKEKVEKFSQEVITEHYLRVHSLRILKSFFRNFLRVENKHSKIAFFIKKKLLIIKNILSSNREHYLKHIVKDKLKFLIHEIFLIKKKTEFFNIKHNIAKSDLGITILNYFKILNKYLLKTKKLTFFELIKLILPNHTIFFVKEILYKLGD